ncbi:hypothetical protein NX059_001432 [Plenodomus lindquistii]|nr:hypothetical protein NX059_001432 [Plenodomus lindquistii]
MNTEEDLIDDSMGVTPMAGLQTPQNLQTRFITRLEHLLKLKVKMEENVSERSMVITLTPDARLGLPTRAGQKKTCVLIQGIQKFMSQIAKGSNQDAARGQLRDEILLFNYESTKDTIEAMNDTFENNKLSFDDFVTNLFGVNDVAIGGSIIDGELGNQLINLHHKVDAYNKSMKETNMLIEYASQMTRVNMQLRDRLRELLGTSAFSSDIYRLICELGFPERVYSTLVRAAGSSKTFENVTFILPPISSSSSSSKRVSFVSPTGSPSQAPGKFAPQQKRVLSSMRSQSPSSPHSKWTAPATHGNKATSTVQVRLSDGITRQVASPNRPPAAPQPTARVTSPATPFNEKSKRLQQFEASVAEAPTQSDADPLATVRPYLPLSDRNLTLYRLEPASKQITAHLIAAVLRGALPPVESETWYQFGFAATRDKEDEYYLGRLYATIIKEAKSPEVAFGELMKAVETGDLVRLFDAKEYSHFRRGFPHLELFLNTSPEKRPTVWRLKQFICSGSQVEPPACLQRDYGFKFCRHREEVDRMKVVYATMLKKIGPLAIHSYCLVNRLYEEGIFKTGISMDAKDKRLMCNDYPSAFLGLDNDKGLEAYRGPFFKRALK